MCDCNKNDCWECCMKGEAERHAEQVASESEYYAAEAQAHAFMGEYKNLSYQLGFLAMKGMSAAQMVAFPEIPMEMSHEALGILHNWCKQLYLRDITKVSPRTEQAAIAWAQLNGIMPANNWPAWV